ncbi:hypothetical protein K438DRAFT_1787031 [Mycena galopus ATCC 62051]|nr:hypothetical protein K438DRAFT_1787031 [Mycena galopus ATCC 62051]
MDTISDEHCEKLSDFLPAFYANLDPTRIPDENLVDIPSTFRGGAVACAQISLSAIYTMVGRFGWGVNPDNFPELWPRIWTWVQFMDSYRDQFPVVDDHGFVNVVAEFGFCHGLIFAAMPGLRRLLVRAWGPLLECDIPLRAVMGFNSLTIALFSGVRAKTREDVEELIDGAGGSLSDLVDLVVGYIDQITADDGVSVLREESRLEGTIFDFVDDVNRFTSDPRSTTPASLRLGHFSSVLLARHFARSLTAMLGVLVGTESRAPSSSHPIEKRLHALSAGLLRVVLVGATWNKLTQSLRGIVQDILPLSFVYYYEVRILADQLQHVDTLQHAEAFQSSEIFEPWNRFIALASDHIALMLRVDGDKKRFKACDNAQKRDWGKGEHRTHCGTLRSYRLGANQFLRVRERQYLRALLTHHYDAAKLDRIYPAQALVSRPGSFSAGRAPDGFFTLFAYYRGHPDIQVLPLDGTLARVLGEGKDWRNVIFRVARSRQHMEMHVVALPVEGHKSLRYFVIPFRTETARVQNVVAEVGASLGPGATIESVLADPRMKDLEALNETGTH